MKNNSQHSQNRSKLTWTGLLFLCALPLFQSCSSGDDPLVKENEDAAKELLRNLPELKEEIDKNREKINSQKLEGSFSGEINGESFDHSNWKASNSRITFLDFKAKILATISQKPYEGITIELTKNDWANMQFPSDLAGSVYTSTNGEYLNVRYSKKDIDGNVIKEFQSAEGTMTLHQISNDKVRISFDGEGFIGDVRKQERASLNFEIDLDYDFVSSDVRTVQ